MTAVRAYSKDGKLIATYPATIGSEEKPAPSGTLKVRRVAKKPDLHLCIRRTNWDALELAHMVEKGTTVQFIGHG